MACWLLQCDPARYRMLEAALARPETTWTARQYAEKIAVGDKVVFWMSGPQAGAYAIGTVTASAQAIDEDPELDPFWNKAPGSPKTEPRIRATQDRLLIAYPVLRDTVQDDPVLKEMLVIRRPQGTVFPVTEEQFARIEQLANGRPAEWSRDELILTLDLYLDTKAGRVQNRAEAERRLGRLFDRKPDAYEFRIGNFKFLDTGKGFPNSGQDAADVWKEFAERTDAVKPLSQEILARLLNGGGVTRQERDPADVAVTSSPLTIAEGLQLHPLLFEELQRTHAELLTGGELRSRDALEGYYATFRERFGPEALRALDGEGLLSLMHETAPRDGMIYWLEFKDDEEFPAIFGSIAGGSALKYGFYRRQETREWMTGSSSAQRVITTTEAVGLARRNRDQLFAACDLLARLPDDADEAAYVALQGELARVAPDVQGTSWGHKYLSLMYPNKLDDYHAVGHQRFHLIKLLQTPSTEEGRYVNAPRFVALSRALDWPLNHLTTVLNQRNGSPYRYWRVGTRSGDEGESHWDRMHRESVVAIGWPKLGDLSSALAGDQFKEAVRQRLAAAYPADPRLTGRSAQQVAHFCQTIQDGDLVLASDGATVLGIGRINGPYVYAAAEAFPHERSVEWLDVGEWRLPTPEGLRTTVFEYRRRPDNLIAVERQVLDAALPPPKPVKPTEQGARKHAVWSAGGKIGRIQDLLNRKGQAILYGPPGTGKTYWAEQAATALAALWNFGVGLDQLSPQQRERVDGHAPDAYVRVCTFHPSYGYEDFMEGYRPKLEQGTLYFSPEDGIFKKICDTAKKDADGRYYLIIDEINRGNIPSIFGELLTLLDKPKRGSTVVLPLTGKFFAIPDNVFVIGTMNTADRSIALLDTALRRRFGFIELMPDPTTLGDTVVDGIALKPWLAALNQQITAHVGHDGRNLQVGHSYLMSAGRPIHDFRQLARVLQEDILPLLEEYCYEDWDTLERILGSGLVDVAKRRFKSELFEQNRQLELIQAVLAFTPDVSASTVAVAADVATEVDESEDEDEG